MDPQCHTPRSQCHVNTRDSVALRLAVTWGCSARVARQRLDRCFPDAADIVVALMGLGQHDTLAAKMAPLDAALAAWAGPPPFEVAVLEQVDADAREDCAEARYHLNPCRETAMRWVKELARDCFHAERLMASLRLRWEH